MRSALPLAFAVALLGARLAADEGHLDAGDFHPPAGFFAGPELENLEAPGLYAVSRPAVDGTWAAFAWSRPPEWDLTWQLVTPGGQLDPCSIAFADAAFFPSDARFDRDGRLLVAGSVYYTGDLHFRLFVARFLYPGCTLDSDFDGDGYFTYDPGVDVERPRLDFVVLAPPLFPERILIGATLGYGVASSDAYDVMLVRLTASGAFDSAFDGDGIWVGDYEDDDNRLSDLVVDPSDRIVLAGTAGSGDPGRDVLLQRLLPDGAPDPTFGFGGARRFHQGSTDRADTVTALERSENGDLYLVGQSISSSSNRFVVSRISGEHGFHFADVFWPSAAGDDLVDAILQGDHRLLLAGQRPSESNSTLFTLAYQVPDLTLDPRYNDLSDFDPLTPVDLGVADMPHERAIGIALSRERPLVAGYVTDGDFDFEAVSPLLARLENDHVFSDGFERGSASAWD